MDLEWSEDFPTEPGAYWFYGDPWFGSMGKHYYPDAKPENRMHFVQIHKTTDSFLGEVRGQILYKHKFDKEKRQQGYVGKFAKATLPNPPKGMD